MRPVRADLLRLALLLVVTFAAFLPTLSAGFIWDDDGYLTRNPTIRADDGLRRIWFTTETKDYYPLLYTSFWIQWRLWHGNPAPYHAINLLLHAIASILLWRTLAAARVPGAWLCGLLFAVHPLNVESVAWIAQQKNTLALLLFTGSTWALTRYLDAGRRAAYGLALLLFALSLLAKPLAAFWPLLIPPYAAWVRRGPMRENLTTTIPFLVASAMSGVVTIYFQQAHSLAGQEVTGGGSIARLTQMAGAWLFYLRKSLWPTELCAIYPPSAIALDQPVFWILAASVIGVLVALTRRGHARPGLLALGFYTAMLLPVSGLFAVGFMFYAPVADHWAYAALIAVVAAVVAPAAALWARIPAGRPARLAGIAVAATAVALLAVGTHVRCEAYRDQETLFRDTLHRNPQSWAAHTILGTAAFGRGDLEEARSHFEAALSLKPGYWEALHGLGVVYAAGGEPERAIPLFEEVLRQRPDHAWARANLERARREAGRSP